MYNSKSMTFLVPALNEEARLGPTIENIFSASRGLIDDFEIFIYDDGSSDRTFEVAQKLEDKYSNVVVFKNKHPRGPGFCYFDGISKSSKEYFMEIHGKNDISSEQLRKILKAIGKATVVIPFQENYYERHFIRRSISKIFVATLNFSFRLKLRYYNHYCIIPKNLLECFSYGTSSYAFQAEVLIMLLKKEKVSYIEVGVRDVFDNQRKSRSYSFQNFVGVALFYLKMLREIYCHRGSLR